MKKAYMKFLAFGLLLLICSAVYAQGVDPIRELAISPNPMDKFTEIQVDFSIPCDVNIFIEDSMGNIIASLYTGYVKKEIALNWNRVDKAGNYVAAGKYNVVVSYETRYTSTKKTLILK